MCVAGVARTGGSEDIVRGVLQAENSKIANKAMRKRTIAD
jgi:hypothetical protein